MTSAVTLCVEYALNTGLPFHVILCFPVCTKATQVSAGLSEPMAQKLCLPVVSVYVIFDDFQSAIVGCEYIWR